MTREDLSRAFGCSPMKRAKLRGLKRNAAVVLGNVGTSDDVDVLTRALDDPEPLPSSSSGQAVCEHAVGSACLPTPSAVSSPLPALRAWPPA